MFFRAIALSLALFVGIGTITSYISNSTEAGPRYTKSKKKKIKKYSKAWWRWYHTQKRKKRISLARKRALRAKQILLARQKTQKVRTSPIENASVRNIEPLPDFPKSQNNESINKDIAKQVSTNELRFRVKSEDGTELGSATLSIVRLANVKDPKNKLDKIGGVPKTTLRQDVVSKMVNEKGWVVNDFIKTVNGEKVYVVIGESLDNGIGLSHVFYFTEVGGKIYSLATTSSKEALTHISKESEKVIESLQRNNSLSKITR